MSSSPASSSTASSKAVDVIDLEDLVKRWAVQMFDYTKNKEQARIPKEHLVFNVDWRRVRFVHHDPQFVDQMKPPTPKSQVKVLSSDALLQLISLPVLPGKLQLQLRQFCNYIIIITLS